MGFCKVRKESDDQLAYYEGYGFNNCDPLGEIILEDFIKSSLIKNNVFFRKCCKKIFCAYPVHNCRDFYGQFYRSYSEDP